MGMKAGTIPLDDCMLPAGWQYIIRNFLTGFEYLSYKTIFNLAGVLQGPTKLPRKIKLPYAENSQDYAQAHDQRYQERFS